ncbi:hypothetical protein TNCV_228091 [Trichonephila clavipes]|nr:hypothetical protein TNCV_228091 [Trichonephila clavipes]
MLEAEESWEAPDRLQDGIKPNCSVTCMVRTATANNRHSPGGTLEPSCRWINAQKILSWIQSPHVGKVWKLSEWNARSGVVLLT